MKPRTTTPQPDANKKLDSPVFVLYLFADGMCSPFGRSSGHAPQSSADQHIGEGTAYCRQVLSNLLDISNEMAEILAYQTRSQSDDPAAARATVAVFTPLAQSIRRTIMLHEKLAKPAKPRSNRIAARKRIIRDVEDAIQREARSPSEQETLHGEFLDRLDRPDLDDEIADRSPADIVTDITRDLGVTGVYDAHPAKRRTPHDIAILNARAAQIPGAAPSAELRALLAATPPPEDYSKLDMKTLMLRTGHLRES
jgi:hypothetical protein